MSGRIKFSINLQFGNKFSALGFQHSTQLWFGGFTYNTRLCCRSYELHLHISCRSVTFTGGLRIITQGESDLISSSQYNPSSASRARLRLTKCCLTFIQGLKYVCGWMFWWCLPLKECSLTEDRAEWDTTAPNAWAVGKLWELADSSSIFCSAEQVRGDAEFQTGEGMEWKHIRYSLITHQFS